MSNRYRNELKSSLVIPVGWLFADLLLAVAMLFLVANTVGIQPPKPTPTPIPTRVLTTPTVTPEPRLELTRHRLHLNVDPTGLLNNSPGVIRLVEQQFTRQPFLGVLQGRCVGFVVVLGGALNGDANIAVEVAGQVYKILDRLARDGYSSAFKMAAHYDALFSGFYPPTNVTVDLYLFSKETQDCYR
jgi:hypothetical protein